MGSPVNEESRPNTKTFFSANSAGTPLQLAWIDEHVVSQRVQAGKSPKHITNLAVSLPLSLLFEWNHGDVPDAARDTKHWLGHYKPKPLQHIEEPYGHSDQTNEETSKRNLLHHQH